VLGIEVGISPAERPAPVIVDDLGADLEQQMGAIRALAHLLLLDYPLADDPVDRGFSHG
jgi:hypothetical protein